MWTSQSQFHLHTADKIKINKQLHGSVEMDHKLFTGRNIQYMIITVPPLGPTNSGVHSKLVSKVRLNYIEMSQRYVVLIADIDTHMYMHTNNN